MPGQPIEKAASAAAGIGAASGVVVPADSSAAAELAALVPAVREQIGWTRGYAVQA